MKNTKRARIDLMRVQKVPEVFNCSERSPGWVPGRPQSLGLDSSAAGRRVVSRRRRVTRASPERKLKMIGRAARIKVTWEAGGIVSQLPLFRAAPAPLYLGLYYVFIVCSSERDYESSNPGFGRFDPELLRTFPCFRDQPFCFAPPAARLND